MVVDVAENGPDGLHLLLTGDYDFAIIDVMLSGRAGWEILATRIVPGAPRRCCS